MPAVVGRGQREAVGVTTKQHDPRKITRGSEQQQPFWNKLIVSTLAWALAP